MPLIERKIMVEGEDGKTVVRSYYVNEKPASPYRSKAGNRIDQRNRKASRFLHRKVRRDEKGYIWQMGYNHCVGHYSPGSNYSRFGGSSLNRNNNLKYATSVAG